MKFTIQGMDYRISFRHLLADHDDGAGIIKLAEQHLKRKEWLIYGATEALIECHDTGMGVWRNFSAGYAFCYAGDQYMPEFGRRLSLKRAIEARGLFSKTQRSQIWTAYFSRSGTDIRTDQPSLRELEMMLRILDEETTEITRLALAMRAATTGSRESA